MVDIKFIAKMAGVSTATVSRVLNKSKPVSAELEKRVLDAVVKYKYYPNIFARVLVNKRSFMICILIEETINQFQSLMLPLVSRYLLEKGYQAIINIVSADTEEKIRTFEALEAKQIDGVIAFFYIDERTINRIKSKTQIPFIQSEPLVHSVSYYEINRKAAYQATQYLIDLGHRKIAGFFAESYENSFLSARYEGYMQALHEANIEINEKLCIKKNISMANSIEMVNELLNQPELPTALFCVSDELAIGAMFQLAQKGLKVPKDISIIGYDGIPMGKQIDPKLTTIEQPFAFWIKLMIKELLGTIEGAETTNISQTDIVKYSPRLFIGGTCDKPREV